MSNFINTQFKYAESIGVADASVPTYYLNKLTGNCPPPPPPLSISSRSFLFTVKLKRWMKVGCGVFVCFVYAGNSHSNVS